MIQIFRLLKIEDKLEYFSRILSENLEDFSEYFAYKSILEKENPFINKMIIIPIKPKERPIELSKLYKYNLDSVMTISVLMQIGGSVTSGSAGR